MSKEGIEFARRFNALGVSAFVLKYRLAEYGHPAPLRDVLRAVRLVRSRAAGLGVRPDRIGVMGASAGVVTSRPAPARSSTRPRGAPARRST